MKNDDTLSSLDRTDRLDWGGGRPIMPPAFDLSGLNRRVDRHEFLAFVST